MLPTDKEERKARPVYSGLFEYFPAALVEVAHVSYVGNEQHNPGQECFDNREKSNDDYDCMLRHLVEAEEDDDDGLLHAAKVAWRALRACQKILEERGAPTAPAARWPGGPEYVEVEPLHPGDKVRDIRDDWEGVLLSVDEFGPNIRWYQISGNDCDTTGRSEMKYMVKVVEEPETGRCVVPSLERIPGMHHREYYKFDPDEAVSVCNAANCWSLITSADTPIMWAGKHYCSYICANGAS